jgi:hypothetical protein
MELTAMMRSLAQGGSCMAPTTIKSVEQVGLAQDGALTPINVLAKTSTQAFGVQGHALDLSNFHCHRSLIAAG